MMSLNNTEKLTLQQLLPYIICWAMLLGMLYSRAILSISMLWFAIIALQPQGFKQRMQSAVQDKFLWSSVIFFVAYVCSGLWSSNTGKWLVDVQVKLPFLCLPFAFHVLHFRNYKDVKVLLYGILLILMSGMAFSFIHALINPSYYVSAGMHLLSPMEGDYIRFTIAVVFGIVLIMYLNSKMNDGAISSNRLEKGLGAVWCAIAVVYLHIQSSKTGLLCLYTVFVVLAMAYLIRKKKIGVFISIIALGLAGVLLLSRTAGFKNQLHRIDREILIWKQQDYSQFNTASSIVPRLISYQIAWDNLKHNMVLGLGAGDLSEAMHAGYQQRYPFVEERYRIMPHNQFICTALAIGVVLAISLPLMLLTIMKTSFKKNSLYLVLSTFIMLIGLMIEPMLEVQFGVFVFLFFLLLMRAVTVEPKLVYTHTLKMQ
jgi:O-antigen ligase